MNRNVARQYPKWRRRCLDCVHLGTNTTAGIYCKRNMPPFDPENDKEKFSGLILITKDVKPFTCKRFVQWASPFEKKKKRK